VNVRELRAALDALEAAYDGGDDFTECPVWLVSHCCGCQQLIATVTLERLETGETRVWVED